MKPPVRQLPIQTGAGRLLKVRKQLVGLLPEVLFDGICITLLPAAASGFASQMQMASQRDTFHIKS